LSGGAILRRFFLYANLNRKEAKGGYMVPANTLYTMFVQRGNSCILASYAVGAHHFTKLGVYNYFWDYCKHFNLSPSSDKDAELKYNNDFHPRYNSCSGYQIIEHLHNCSRQSAFVKSRAKFGVEYIHQPIHRLQQIEKSLKYKEVLVSVAIKEHRGVHAYCVGFDKQGFYMIETRGGNYKSGINRISNIQSLGTLQDSLLMSANPTSKKSSGGNYGLRKSERVLSKRVENHKRWWAL